MTILTPTPQQQAWQRLELGFFCHFGVNTFHGLEWSDGTLPAESFNPRKLDARQWVRTAKDAGARYFILTAKHHDGFCLWPTGTTEYSVRSARWHGGKGDVVREVATACAEEGVKLGLYLSPWDRNSEHYSDPAAYDRFYLEQLRELCTNYGELVELWFDGAGSEGRRYDWPAISSLINELQPQAMVFNMGEPTIRWVGNEDGLAADPVNYVVDQADFSNYTVETASFSQALYLPPECDVSLRRGWFWAEHDQPKELDHLLSIYYNSIGMGANLLLNAPPDRDGVIPKQDVARLKQWRAELDRRFANPVEAKIVVEDDHWVADFGKGVSFDHLELSEDLTAGQRVRSHSVRLDDDRKSAALTIGHKRIHVCEPVHTRQVRIDLVGDEPRLASVRAFLTGVSDVGQVDYLASTKEPDEQR